jgi:hypothetical protein
VIGRDEAQHAHLAGRPYPVIPTGAVLSRWAGCEQAAPRGPKSSRPPLPAEFGAPAGTAVSTRESAAGISESGQTAGAVAADAVIIFKTCPPGTPVPFALAASINWLRTFTLLYIRAIMPSEGIAGGIRWMGMLDESVGTFRYRQRNVDPIGLLY